MNEENRKQVIGLVAVLLVLGGALWFSVFKKDSSGPSIEASPTGSSQQTLAAAEAAGVSSRISSVFQEAPVDLQELIVNIKEVEFNYKDAHDSRNPTAALVGDPMLFRARRIPRGGDELAENLLYEANRKNLSGIIWDDVTPLAVIDNAVVYVGYEFEEPIIVKTIERDYVVLAITGEDIEVVRQLKEQ